MRRPWKKAVLVLLLLGVHGLGLLAGTYDLHAHAHRICPEHGEVLHAEEAHPPHLSSERTLVAEHASEHAHCALAAHFRPQTPRVSLPELCSTPTPVSDVPALRLENPHLSAIPLYRLAPKNSPPA